MMRPTTFLGTALLGLVLIVGTCSAFIGPTNNVIRRQSRHLAYIFGVEDDGSVVPPQSSGNGYYSQTPSPSTVAMSGLATLNEARASLTRVAAAFSPNHGHSLSLNAIEDIHVLELEEASMELQAVVCEHEQCVTVAIPIDFPTPCTVNDNGHDNNNMEECLLSNLNELDHQAQQILEQNEYREQKYEQVQAYERQTQNLLSMEDAALPAWWLTPTDTIVEQECRSLQSLLNEEEFQHEIRSLAEYYLDHNQAHGEEAEMPVVQQAAVSSICPAGIFIRAVVEQEGQGIVVDIPFVFPIQTTDSMQLRATVIETIEQFS